MLNIYDSEGIRQEPTVNSETTVANVSTTLTADTPLDLYDDTDTACWIEGHLTSDEDAYFTWTDGSDPYTTYLRAGKVESFSYAQMGPATLSIVSAAAATISGQIRRRPRND